MIEGQDVSTDNWAIGHDIEILNKIHLSHVNIAIYERDTSSLASELDTLIKRNIEFRSTGDVNSILSDLQKVIDPDGYLRKDIEQLLYSFVDVSKAKDFRLLLAVVRDNMCRKFHTDINDLRMLCTYRGPGTLWLTEDNIDTKALEVYGENASIVIDESKVRQAPTGAVVLLKGAIYPQEETKAAVHRSPTIEESGAERLLLRIDTNDFLNFN